MKKLENQAVEVKIDELSLQKFSSYAKGDAMSSN